MIMNKNDKPTIALPNGYKEWRNKCGKLYREGDKPAAVYADGNKEWWKNGKLVRIEN